MGIKINFQKAIVWGIVVAIFQLLLGNFLYMNSFVSGIFTRYSDYSFLKPAAFFGGMDNWFLITTLFNIIIIIVFIALYLLFYKSIPGAGWIKGLFFGIIFGFVRTVPEAFNQWMLFKYSGILILAQMIIAFLGMVIFGIVLALVFQLTSVIEGED